MNQVDDDYHAKEYQNVNGLVGCLIANGMATLNELRTIYSLEDAMDMYEAYIIPKFNEWKRAKLMETKK